jgi:uncharacterized protein YkwD
MGPSLSDPIGVVAPSRRAAAMSRAWMRRVAVTVALSAGFCACAAAEAGAFTLQLVFPDGQPMTYGSACAGVGCMARGDGIESTDDHGEIRLDGRARTIEYRRDGIQVQSAPPASASGIILAVGDRATVVLPHLLASHDPAIDAFESDLVARLNEARAAQGLALAQINPQLSTAADMQATWLTRSGVTFSEPSLFHLGPFETDLAFRHGEASLPGPAAGGEIAEAGGTIEETVYDWLSSPEHRAQVLTSGQLLIGAARVGSFTIVQTHRRCDGCDQDGTGTRVSAPPPPVAAPVTPPPAPAPAPAPAVPTVGSSLPAPAMPSCGRERLTTKRLQSRRGRVRLRISAQCLRPGARYAVLIRQGTSGRMLRTLRIARAGSRTVTLRPARSARRLRITFKRDGRVIVARTMSLRT